MDSIEEYILKHIDEEGELLADLNRTAHVKLLRPRMISGHLQGRLLKMFCRMMQPKRVLEIGTYTGYATLCLAEGTSDDAIIYTVEKNDEMQPFAEPFIDRSPYRHKIKMFWGDFVELYPSFDEEFDLIYIDADKRDYSLYYDMVFPSLKKGGLILADNTLWSGKVIEEDISKNDKQTIGILSFNEKIKHDDRIEKVIIPMRDGLTMIWKK
jgi:predicted O-methyltransferase YrrM